MVSYGEWSQLNDEALERWVSSQDRPVPYNEYAVFDYAWQAAWDKLCELGWLKDD